MLSQVRFFIQFQILLSSSATLDLIPAAIEPQSCAIHLHLTAEDLAKDFRLTPGTIRPSFIA
ncbi:hypothetical protein FIBSPDRAFT_260869 [Athelia psychrophila]|uniref:GntR family transcriptional regulator n=1 Tax=Athelia psychrophila TaxID=1759441 RepID=A0A166RQY0_9AGAM|nr:hypothetical protein FIBSPDRAFT_260869 [Fibularhizoctonia sp. CBS 109695]